MLKLEITNLPLIWNPNIYFCHFYYTFETILYADEKDFCFTVFLRQYHNWIGAKSNAAKRHQVVYGKLQQ